MSKATPTNPPPKELTDCPQWGEGGQYVVDPATGLRTLVARTESLAAKAAPATAPLTEEV